MKVPIAFLGIMAIAGCITASLVNGSLPFFPIEISYTACESPGYEIFFVGMTTTALLVYLVYVHHINRAVKPGQFVHFIGVLTCISLAMLSWFDVCHFYWVHFTFVTVFFFSANYLVYFKHGNTFYGLAPSIAFFIYGVFLPLQWWVGPSAQFWNQVGAPFQWLTVLMLGLGICAKPSNPNHHSLFN